MDALVESLRRQAPHQRVRIANLMLEAANRIEELETALKAKAKDKWECRR